MGSGNVSHLMLCDNISPDIALLNVINGFCTIIVIAFGLIGNVGSIVMVRQFRISKVLLYYLVTLALWDTALLLCTCGYYSLQTLLTSIGCRMPWLLYGSVLFHGPNHIAMTCSVWMVIVITAARYFAISNPLRNKTTSSPRLARWICVVVSVVSLLYNCPTFLELYLKECKRVETLNNKTVVSLGYAVDGTELRLNPYYILCFRVIMNIVFVSLVPFLVIAVLTIKLITLIKKSKSQLCVLTQKDSLAGTAALQKQKQGRKEGSIASSAGKGDQVERQITVMLVVLLIKFLCCYTLPTLINIWELIDGQARSALAFACIADIGNLLVVVNSATNFLVYFRWRHNLRRSSLIKKKKSLATELMYDCSDVDRAAAERQSLLPNAASPMLNEHNFTYHQVATLRQSWTELNKTVHSKTLGLEMMTQILSANPSFGKVFEETGSECEEAEATRFEKHSCMMHSFIEGAISDYELAVNRRDSGQQPSNPFNKMMTSPGICLTRERALQVGHVHRQLGATLNNHVYVTFKRCMLKCILDTEQTYEQMCAHGREHAQPEAVVWNRFLSLLISDLKLGYNGSNIREINRPFEHHDSATF